MKGQILHYSIQDDSGVISAEDGNRYRFQSSDWRSQDAPRNGEFVDFEPYEGVALDIYLDIEKNEASFANQPRAAAHGEVKNRTAFVLLAIFLGNFGVHNFYAGYIGRGIAQLVISILTCWLFFPLIGVWIWAVIEACTVTKDAKGVPFAN